MNTQLTPSIAQALEQFTNPPTPFTDKLVKLAQEWREEDEDERRRIAEQDDYWERRAAAEEARAESNHTDFMERP